MRFLLLIIAFTAIASSALFGEQEPAIFANKKFTVTDFADSINYYIKKGKEKALLDLKRRVLPGVTDFKRPFSINERIGWIGRVVFIPKDKFLRPPAFGALQFPYNKFTTQNWPLYPIALAGSSYFVLSSGYDLAGYPEDPKDYLIYCEKNGIFRHLLLPVPTRDQASADLALLKASKSWTEELWSYRGHFSNKDYLWPYIAAQATDNYGQGKSRWHAVNGMRMRASSAKWD